MIKFFKIHKWTYIPVMVLSVTIVTAVLLISYLNQDLPSISELESFEPWLVTHIYSADGVLLNDLDAMQKRERVSIYALPDNLIQAVLSTEDRRFYKHWGLDLRRIIKAAYVNISTGNLTGQGAGTITGQLARDLYLNRRKEWKRKFQEALTVLQIERTFSKNEILELYLNQMSFGHHAYGVQSAARVFFDKDARDLQVHESALLIGLLKAPNWYSPFRHPERATQRRNVVFASLLACGHITRAEFDSLKILPLGVIEESEEENKLAPYFCEFVRIEMEKKYGQGLYTDGLSIYTTLDTRAQAVADSVYHSYLPELQKDIHGTMIKKHKFNKWTDPPLKTPEEIEAFLRDTALVDSFFNTPRLTLQGALVALNPQNGYVMAMIGGRNFEESKFNRAVQMERQPGSAFKPFTYTVAIDNGFPTTYELLNQPIALRQADGSRWTPENYDKSTGGLTTLREGLRRSLNLIAARLLLEVIQSPKRVADMAKRFGFTTTIYPYETICLGASDVKLIELTSAYGVFANRGEWVEPIMVTRVEDKNGNIIDEFFPDKKEVISEQTNYIMTDLLATVINHGTGANARWKYHFNRPAGGKTGTTNDYTNALFVGYTPQIAAGVWVGFDDQHIKLGEGKTGAIAALPIWAPFMRMVHDSLHLPLQDFVEPAGVIRMDVCAETKDIARESCPQKLEEIFLKEYAPVDSCQIHNKPGQHQTKKRVVF